MLRFFLLQAITSLCKQAAGRRERALLASPAGGRLCVKDASETTGSTI